MGTFNLGQNTNTHVGSQVVPRHVTPRTVLILGLNSRLPVSPLIILASSLKGLSKLLGLGISTKQRCEARWVSLTLFAKQHIHSDL